MLRGGQNIGKCVSYWFKIEKGSIVHICIGRIYFFSIWCFGSVQNFVVEK
jgi:hypothetical protein